VIELLEGKPPYYSLEPMQALFRIVQDDMPPIPDGASAVSETLLMKMAINADIELQRL
jgi:hypothetical protein